MCKFILLSPSPVTLYVAGMIADSVARRYRVGKFAGGSFAFAPQFFAALSRGDVRFALHNFLLIILITELICFILPQTHI